MFRHKAGLIFAGVGNGNSNGSRSKSKLSSDTMHMDSGSSGSGVGSNNGKNNCNMISADHGGQEPDKENDPKAANLLHLDRTFCLV